MLAAGGGGSGCEGSPRGSFLGRQPKEGTGLAWKCHAVHQNGEWPGDTRTAAQVLWGLGSGCETPWEGSEAGVRFGWQCRGCVPR